MIIAHEITYKTNRCPSCGTFWAVEQDRSYTVTCPRCAQLTINAANDRYEAAKRSMQSLRGALTRLKK